MPGQIFPLQSCSEVESVSKVTQAAPLQCAPPVRPRFYQLHEPQPGWPEPLTFPSCAVGRPGPHRSLLSPPAAPTCSSAATASPTHRKARSTSASRPEVRTPGSLCVWASSGGNPPCSGQVSALGCSNEEQLFTLISLLAICNCCALLLSWGGRPELCTAALVSQLQS